MSPQPNKYIIKYESIIFKVLPKIRVVTWQPKYDFRDRIY